MEAPSAMYTNKQKLRGGGEWEYIFKLNFASDASPLDQ